MFCWPCFKNWIIWEFFPCYPETGKLWNGECHNDKCWYWLREYPKCDRHRRKEG